MLRIKRLDIFIIKSFLLLFVGTFFICLFIFMMQFLWKYVDELVGKGLEIDVYKRQVYTSVIYIAKSVLELAVLERKQGEQDPFWKDCAERHFLSAKKAIDQLVASQGDFQTEGELTFEDGMISCSALQIGMMGVLEKDAETRKYYTDAMLKILNSHDCLTQLRVPDGRRRQGTMRYWEAQYLSLIHI